ncbi:MAG: hypothetical protein GXP25_10070 [Planctomycetes bacterium]|nr:hypothetical protein [Planctomycetota bacterium]
MIRLKTLFAIAVLCTPVLLSCGGCEPKVYHNEQETITTNTEGGVTIESTKETRVKDQ